MTVVLHDEGASFDVPLLQFVLMVAAPSLTGGCCTPVAI
jgi:hypothetical protein